MQEQKEELKREIGVRGLAANSFNLTLGAGIFALPAIVYKMVGPAGIFAYLICGFAMIIILLCFAEIGSKISTSGGSYAYVNHALGPFPGFITNMLMTVGFAMAADAAVSNALLDTFSPYLIQLKDPLVRAFILLLIFGGLAWVNIRGTKKAVHFIELNTLAKLLPLVIMVMVGFFVLNPANLSIVHWPNSAQLGQVCLVLFFAFGGTDSALSASGEIKNPAFTVPRGLLLGILTVLLLYFSIQLVATGVLGSELINHPEAPLAYVALAIFGQAGITIILIATFLSMFGTIAGDFLASPRVFFAGGTNGIMPKFLAQIHPTFKTPHMAIITFASITFIFSISGAFRELAVLSSSALLTVYVMVCISTIKMRLTEKEKSVGFRNRGGITVPVLGLLIVIWFLSHMARKEWLALFGFILICSGYYFIVLRKRPKLI